MFLPPSIQCSTAIYQAARSQIRVKVQSQNPFRQQFQYWELFLVLPTSTDSNDSNTAAYNSPQPHFRYTSCKRMVVRHRHVIVLRVQRVDNSADTPNSTARRKILFKLWCSGDTDVCDPGGISVQFPVLSMWFCATRRARIVLLPSFNFLPEPTNRFISTTLLSPPSCSSFALLLEFDIDVSLRIAQTWGRLRQISSILRFHPTLDHSAAFCNDLIFLPINVPDVTHLRRSEAKAHLVNSCLAVHNIDLLVSTLPAVWLPPPSSSSVETFCASLLFLSDCNSSDLTSELVRLRMNVLQPHAASHPSSGIFDNLDRLPKASVISLASLRGLTPESTVDKLRNQLFTHIGSGGCGSYHMRNPSLACASLLKQLFPETDLAPSKDMTENVQIELLTQLKHRLTRVPLCRILTMHNVKCSQSDGTETLRRILGAYPKRLNQGKPNKDPKVKRTTGVRREKEKIQSDWPRVLRVIEASMIALYREKCWIIQLREDDGFELTNVERIYGGQVDQHSNNAKSGTHPLHAPGPGLEDVNDVAEVDKYHLCGIIHQALRMVDGEVNEKLRSPRI
ncbi:hypothetical protein DFH08DRAFT_821185 [Mycena albidolilacea]|uniref:Uncharacterized protein n=1 Tax=Mycena albidolilacea TaxID=1033008 RepID=A0AAD6ZAW7_9AGAR|nr:hypothetical protein DFH08DRAFT_821185 [Mycena albidolilacea]